MENNEIQEKIIKLLESIDWPTTTEEVAKQLKISWNTAQIHLLKLVAQGTTCVGFGIAYVTLIVAHWITAVVLLALSFALFYQARIAKIKPEQSI